MNQATRDTAFKELVEGAVVGTSDWVRIDQAMIDLFARATLDPDPMHVDPAWAEANSPYRGTISFGFLTTGLLTHLLHSALGTNPVAHNGSVSHLNYGFDRLRLIEPVPVGGQVRGHFRVLRVQTDERRRTFITFGCEVEIEGLDRPALVAEWLTVSVPIEAGA